MRILVIGCAIAVPPALGCGPRAGDINRVQPNYVDKSLFANDHEWYYRRTIVSSETTNRFAIEGQGDIWMDRVRFRIEQDWLLAYRPYEAIPGAQDAEYDGNTTFEGSVIAAWPIIRHFDIQREYDPLTGNATNVIVENTTDRVWNERDYMRVDFAHNAVESSITAGRGVSDFPLSFVSSGSQYRHCDSNLTDPYCSRFTVDTIDIVDQTFLGMDLLSCAAFVGYSSSGVGQCGYGRANVRHNFTRIRNPSDYVPRDYPDSIVRKTPEGEPIYDEDTGEVLRESYYNRFGIFRLGIPTYDRGYGTTETGRLFRAMLFNLWERHTDETGRVIPYADRSPKPIIYYLNTDFPPRWRQAAEEAAREHDRVLTKMVRDATEFAPDFPMFEIRDNDCNAENIKRFVGTDPNYLSAVARVVCANGQRCNSVVGSKTQLSPVDLIGPGNLTSVCTSLENATRDPVTNIPKFDWQRIGDSRWNMLVWLPNPQQSGWGGYGPMHADARTGETVSASAFIRGYTYEVGAATIVDYIEFINDEETIEDVVHGLDVRKHTQQTLARAQAMGRERAGRRFLSSIDRRMNRLGTSQSDLLFDIDPNFQRNRLARIQGTAVEAAMIDPLRMQAASRDTLPIGHEQLEPRNWRPGEPASEGLRKAATPQGWMDYGNPLSIVRGRTRHALTAAGFCFLRHDFDPHWAGLALQLRSLDRQQRYEFVGNMLIKHVILHELGHNFGLTHNFEGSYDALNYFDEFWDNHWQDDATRVANRYDENRNTTVMEYMAQKGAFTDRLGKYDEAALRFAYLNQINVFRDPRVDGGENLRNWRYYNDYNKIPDYICDGDGAGCRSEEEAQAVLKARTWVAFDPQNPPSNEVPYLFCDNFYDRRTPFCSTFDYGSSQREIFANYYSMWSDYFFFNNFIRDRLVPLSWTPSQAMLPAFYAMLHWSTVGQYLYFFRAFEGSDFLETDLASDMLTTVGHGLNFAAEVMSTPEPIRMCPWPGVTDPQIFIPWYFLNDCDERAALNSEYALAAEQIHVPLGPGRPETIGFTEDYVDFDWKFVGSYFDKTNMMWLLGLVRPNLFMRFDFQESGLGPHQRFNYSVFRLFEPEIRRFYSELVRIDPDLLQGSTATSFGSYWCRDPDNPRAAHMGYYEPRRMVDVATGLAEPGPTSSCLDAGVIFPAMQPNFPFDAMFYVHALFSSEFDTALDLSKAMKVYVLGSDDDFPEWDLLDSDDICFCVDGVTGLEYRAIRQPAGIPSMGCDLIERACIAQSGLSFSHTSEDEHERVRRWFERLEWARQLARTFDRY